MRGRRSISRRPISSATREADARIGFTGDGNADVLKRDTSEIGHRRKS